MIKFEFEGKHYQVDDDAYVLEKIVLPDGQLIQINGWHETKPPEPIKLYVITHDFKGSPAEIADHFRASLARSDDPLFNELTEEVSKLNSLLQDPQPGLFSWNDFVHIRCVNIKKILDQKFK